MNHARALAFDVRERRAMRTVELFFAAFTEGRNDAARKLCGPGFTWFGKSIDASGWSTPRAKTFHREAAMKLSKLRSLPGALIAPLKATFDQELLFEGKIGEDVLIALVDVTVAGNLVTVGVVVEELEDEPWIARVFDPNELKSALQRLGPRPSA